MFQFLIIVASLVMFVFGLVSDAPDGDLKLLAFSFVPTLLMVAAIGIFRIKDTFHPLALISYILFLSVPLKTFFLLYLDEDGVGKYTSLGIYDVDILWGGIRVITVAIVALLAGYGLHAVLGSKSAPSSVRDFRASSFRTAGLMAIATSAVAAILFINATGAWGDLLSGRIFTKRYTEADGQTVVAAFTYLRILGQTVPQVVFLGGLNFILGSKLSSVFDKLILALLFAFSMIIPLISSSRLELAYLFIFITIFIHYYIRKIPTRTIVVLGVFLLATLTILGELRRTQGSYYGGEVEFGAHRIIEQTVGRAYFMDIGKTSAIVAAFPKDLDYLHGESLLKIFIAPIPRSLWPDKPLLALNKFVEDEVLQRDTSSGVPPGFVGEMYMNFGYFGVIVGNLLVGIFMSIIYSKISNNNRNVNGVMLIIITVLTAMTLYTVEITNFVSALFRYYAAFFLFVFPYTEKKSLRRRASIVPPTFRGPSPANP